MKRLHVAALALALALGTSALAQTPQTAPSTAGRPTAPAASPATAAAPASRTPLIDINSASKEELDALPGIGPARAEAIIKGRPYKGKDELTRKKVLPSNVYDGIKDRIVARQS